MSRRNIILARIKAAPALPATAGRVFELINKPNVEFSELLEVVQYDPGLTSNVLRLANSAGSGNIQEIVSLRDALVRLGMKQVTQLILMAAVAPQTSRPVKGYDLPAGQLLEHSIAVAVCADDLARELGTGVSDQVFTAGLLHDIGKVLLGAFVEIDAAPILELAYREQISFEEAEFQVLGIDHTEVGARLLESWKLPPSMILAARWHHQPDRFEGDDSVMVDLVHVADNLSLMAGIGVGIDGLNYYPSREVTARLKLKTLTMESVMSRMMTRLEDIRKALGTNAERE